MIPKMRDMTPRWSRNLLIVKPFTRFSVGIPKIRAWR